MKELITVSELAARLKIHKHTLYRLIGNKAIPFFKIRGVGIRFDCKEIESWIQEGKIEIQDWGEFFENK